MAKSMGSPSLYTRPGCVVMSGVVVVAVYVGAYTIAVVVAEPSAGSRVPVQLQSASMISLMVVGSPSLGIPARAV